MYTVRKLKIGRTAQLDALCLAAGELYTRTVVSFWRTVRKKDVWLKPSSLMRWHSSKDLHVHSADAVVQSFCSSLKSWRKRRKTDPQAKPPHNRRRYFRVQWKNSAIRLKEGTLVLSNGRGNAPVVIPWEREIPALVELGWNGREYELRVVYKAETEMSPIGDRVAGVDLGEVHMAASHDGENCYILNEQAPSFQTPVSEQGESASFFHHRHEEEGLKEMEESSKKQAEAASQAR